jgi:hypothetical protein
LIALATSANVFKSGLIATDPTLVPPTLTLIVWPWVNSSLAGIPLGSNMPLVLDDEGSTPAETNPPEISIPVWDPPPVIPAPACVAKLAVSPNPELLMAPINPVTVFGKFVPVPTEIEVLAVDDEPSEPFTRYFTAIVVVPVTEFSVSLTVAFAVLLERLRNTLFSPLL